MQQQTVAEVAVELVHSCAARGERMVEAVPQQMDAWSTGLTSLGLRTLRRRPARRVGHSRGGGARRMERDEARANRSAVLLCKATAKRRGGEVQVCVRLWPRGFAHNGLVVAEVLGLWRVSSLIAQEAGEVLSSVITPRFIRGVLVFVVQFWGLPCTLCGPVTPPTTLGGLRHCAVHA